MSEEAKKIIAVFGATGLQGGGVVRALQRQGLFRIRAITRDASQAVGLADEVVEADLTRPETLAPALKGAYGVFVVTNFWAGPGVDELAQGEAAVTAAKAAGVHHFIWSTLPNVERISNGRLEVAHFTQKAKVDDAVARAEFEHYTFVEAPFYYQNLAGVMAPQPQADGSKAWAVPMDPDARVIHMGDITELGNVVAGAFAHRDQAGRGSHLSMAGQLMSWNDVSAAFNALGHKTAVQRVPAEAYDGFYPGAREMRAMMQYFEDYSYFGPDAEAKVKLAREVTTQAPTEFAPWAKANLK